MVTREMRTQLQDRLKVDAKAAGMSTVERMLQAQSRLQITAEILAVQFPGYREQATRAIGAVDAAWYIDEHGQTLTLKGDGKPPALADADHTHLAKSDILVTT